MPPHFLDTQLRQRWEGRLQRMQEKYADERFKQIGDLLCKPLRDLLSEEYELLIEGDRGRPVSVSHVQGIVDSIQAIDSELPDPRMWGSRIEFDFWLLQAILDELGAEGYPSRPTLIPVYRAEWGHAGRILPAALGTDEPAYPRLDLMYFPGEDNLAEIDLRQYAWLYHELGHAILERYGGTFRAKIGVTVTKFLDRQSRVSLADKGIARSNSQKMLVALRKYWNSTAANLGWPGELACDILALWATGPAYLSEFGRRARNERWAPFEVTDQHPPYFSRAQALLQAAGQLGWKTELAGVAELLAEWRAAEPDASVMNRFANFAQTELVQACVEHSLSACQALRVPRCDVNRMEQVRTCLKAGKAPDIGTDLIISAQLSAQEMDTSSYNRWQERVVRELQA